MKLSVSSTALTAVSRQRIVSNPKKAFRSSIESLKFFGLLFSITCIFTLKRDHRCWSSIYLTWRAVHHGTVPFHIPAPTSKSRTALFRLFGRMLHLAQRMLHPVDIDSDRKSTRLNSSHHGSSYAVFCLKKKILDVCPL